jgi:hydroxymethylglutaryl-CoA reductase
MLMSQVGDAMGANAVNTACERLAPMIEGITRGVRIHSCEKFSQSFFFFFFCILTPGGRVHLKILSNLADRRIARARCVIPLKELAFGEFSGERVRDGMRWNGTEWMFFFFFLFLSFFFFVISMILLIIG